MNKLVLSVICISLVSVSSAMANYCSVNTAKTGCVDNGCSKSGFRKYCKATRTAYAESTGESISVSTLCDDELAPTSDKIEINGVTYAVGAVTICDCTFPE